MHVVLERVVNQIAVETDGLDAETTQLHPGNLAYRWSTQQVVEHLAIGYHLTSKALESRLKKGRVSRQQGRTWLQWSLQLMILSFGALPKGVPALKETVPTKGQFAMMDGRQLANFLRQEAEAMDALLDTCRQKFGMERVATHPWLGPLRVDQWRRFHVVHGLHHITQVRLIIAELSAVPRPIKLANSLVKELQIPAHRPIA